jgi:hypothetical protein
VVKILTLSPAEKKDERRKCSSVNRNTNTLTSHTIEGDGKRLGYESLAYFKIKKGPSSFLDKKKFRAKPSPFRRVRQSLIASLICLFRGGDETAALLHKEKGSTNRKEVSKSAAAAVYIDVVSF